MGDSSVVSVAPWPIEVRAGKVHSAELYKEI